MNQSINGRVTEICTDTSYLQILNGKCSRGRVDGIDVKKSCITWGNRSYWLALDLQNSNNAVLDSSRYESTSLAADASDSWSSLSGLCITIIVAAALNVLLCMYFSDSFYDVDFTTKQKIAIGFFFTVNLIIQILYSCVLGLTVPSDFMKSDSWATEECTYTASFSFGFYMSMLSFFFSFFANVFVFVSCIRTRNICGSTKAEPKVVARNIAFRGVIPDQKKAVASKTTKSGNNSRSARDIDVYSNDGSYSSDNSSRSADNSDAENGDSDEYEYEDSDDDVRVVRKG